MPDSGPPAENATAAVDDRQPDQRAIFLHIGLPKTGTSYLQNILWNSRERLASDGVLIPGDSRVAQTLAVWDLLGRRPRGADLPVVPGSWDALVASVHAWTGTHTVVSAELLSSANDRQVRRTVRAFAPHDVHVVVTVRDLARVVTATWQQDLTKGRYWSWEEYVAAVRDPDTGPATAGMTFWLRQDVVRILDSWEAVVPRERIHLVTVPPSGSPRDLLLERFAEAVNVDPAALDTQVSAADANVSVGLAEAEVLRQLNLGLAGRLNERQYTRVVQLAVKPALQRQPNATPIRLSAEDTAWAQDKAGALVGALRARSHHVIGDLEDLRPAVDVAGTGPSAAEPGDVAAAALAALVGVTEAYGTFWWRTRRPDRTSEAGTDSRLASWARAVSFRQRVAALELADRHPVLHRAAARYVRRSRRAKAPG